MLLLLIFCSSSEHNKAKKKWLLFGRQHFQMHFLEWKLLNFEQDFTKICSLVSNWQYVSIGSDNGLASNRCQAIIWSNVCMLYWHICITQLQWVNIWAGAVHFLLTISLVMIVGIHVRYLIMIQTEVWITSHQGWGQFHFFNSIPIPIPLFSIPIPILIPLLTISFNSNSNSNSRDFNSNSNSNSGDFKSRQSQFWKWPVHVFLEIDYNYTNKVHAYKIIVINTISLISLVKWL